MKFAVGRTIEHWLLEIGLNTEWASGLKILIIAIIIAGICVLANFIAKELILVVLRKIVKRTKNTWDDVLLENKVFHRFSHLVPAIIIYFSSKYALYGHPDLIYITRSGVFIYVILILMLVVSSFLGALNEIYLLSAASKERPIKGFLQVINIFNFAVGGILILSILIDKNPAYFLTGIGALAAILLLVFKDTLLGLVAGIQLSANNMVKIGDWVSIPSKGADGIVKEISLHTVKIENWDKTITMIPSYFMVSDSFINFRGMEDSQARRVKRSLNIDMKSVHFLSDEEILSLKKMDHIKTYLADACSEIAEANKGIDSSSPANGKRLTNIGTFRKYIELYLHANPNVRQDMILMVRQLQPTEAGMPIELYFFSKIYELEPFEKLQADIFDHLIAVVPLFGLKIFQNPGEYHHHPLK